MTLSGDRLILPFTFIPDGHPDAGKPPPPGWITLRATFTPSEGFTAQAAGVTRALHGHRGDVGSGGSAHDLSIDVAGSRRFDPLMAGVPAFDLLKRLVSGAFADATVGKDVVEIERGMHEAASGGSASGSYRVAQAEGEPAEEEPRGVEGEPLSFEEVRRTEEYERLRRTLERTDPRNPALGPFIQRPGWVPSDRDIADIRDALADAIVRGAGNQPARPRLDPRALLPTTHRLPEGPGRWVENSPRYPWHRPAAATYQQKATGAPEGYEYVVEAPGTASGVKYFDGYDPVTRNLIDAKDWNDYPPAFLMAKEVEEIRSEAEIAASYGSMLELRFSSQATAGMMSNEIEREGIANVVVRYWPVD
jgi:Restriction endonuclease fold toxin 5